MLPQGQNSPAQSHKHMVTIDSHQKRLCCYTVTQSIKLAALKYACGCLRLPATVRVNKAI